MVALRAAGYKHGRTEFYAAEPRRIMEVTMADIKQITPENFDATVNGSLPVLVDFWAHTREPKNRPAREGCR